MFVSLPTGSGSLNGSKIVLESLTLMEVLP